MIPVNSHCRGPVQYMCGANIIKNARFTWNLAFSFIVRSAKRLFCSPDFLEHFLYGSFKLSVLSVQHGRRVVVHQDVRFHLHVFQVTALFHSDSSNLWYSEDDGRVNLLLPPYRRHCTRYRGTYELSYSECLVDIRETAGVGVVVLTDEHAGRFGPLAVRFCSDILSSRFELYIGLS